MTMVGTTGTPYELKIECGKLREFAAATKAAHTSYGPGDAPAIPPTFLVAAAFWMEPGSSVLEQAGLDWSRLLSGGTEFVFHGAPLRAGERLTAIQRVDEIYTKQGRRGGTLTFTVFSTEFRRPDRSLAAEEHHVTISTSQSAQLATRVRAEHPPLATVRPERLPDGPLTVGSKLPEFIDAPVTRTDIVRYQGASGDFNPIHHDDEFAQRAGYPAAFSVGMYHAGILGTYLADLFTPEAVRRLKVEFREQIWPGDVLSYGGIVTSRQGGIAGAPDQFELDLSVRPASGRTHIRASATVWIERRDV